MLGPKPLLNRQLQWPGRGLTWLPTHPTLRQSGQFSIPAWPQVSHSRVQGLWFFQVILSWCSNRITVWPGASREGPWTKDSLHFYILTVCASDSLGSSESSAPAVSQSVRSSGWHHRSLCHCAKGRCQSMASCPRAQSSACTGVYTLSYLH